MLPEADVAFLDEVFLGSTAILNTLLGILNERSFRRGSTSLQCPLRVCVGATNALPDDESLAAFADRFLVRVFLAPVPDGLLEELLAGGWTLDRGLRPGASSLADLDEVASAAAAVDLGPVSPRLPSGSSLKTMRVAGWPAITGRLHPGQVGPRGSPPGTASNAMLLQLARKFAR
jgi:MoxR-like ATPase